MTDKILSSSLQETDQENTIRPKSFSNFIGQSNVKQNLTIFIEAAKKRQQPLDHVLIYGPPGLGKTTIAEIISKEMGVNFKSTAGPVLSKAADLAAILTNLEENDILFIDEIHRITINLEEILYSAMEDFFIDLIIGEGPGARSVKINLAKFTLVGATTRLGLLSNPLRDRFGIPLRLNFYSHAELKDVILRSAIIMGTDIEKEGADEIAKRSRGTPRIALRLLKRVRDFALMQNNNFIDRKTADFSLNQLEVDQVGLDSNDYRYLRFINDNYEGGPVGIETISAALAEQRDAIEDTIEPYLMQIGFLQRSPRGRLLTLQAKAYLSNKI